jgi:hypothetical protein
MNLDPRQGTLDGFELPADALASLREREALGASAEQESVGQEPPLRQPAHQPPAKAVRDTATIPTAPVCKEPIPPVAGASAAGSTEAIRPPALSETPLRSTDAADTAGVTAAEGQPAAGRPLERAASAGPTADAPPGDPLAQNMAALQAALADERRAARESRRLATRLVSIAMATLLVVLVLGVAQTLVSMRVARESVAAQQKTEVLLRAQQTELAAFVNAASAASAGISGAGAALDAKLAVPPPHVAAAQPPGLKHAPRSAHPRKTNEKTRSAIAY